jgi:hypothetical protein
MEFNATFNNISVKSWRSVLLVEETRGPGENHRHIASHWQTLSHNCTHIGLYNEKQNYHAVAIVPTSNRKNIERGNIDASAVLKKQPLQASPTLPL